MLNYSEVHLYLNHSFKRRKRKGNLSGNSRYMLLQKISIVTCFIYP